MIWDEDSVHRIPTIGGFFSIQRMTNIPQMDQEGAIPDPSITGTIILQTRYRIEIDQVQLRRSVPNGEGDGFDLDIVETTWGSVLYRSLDRDGIPIDSNTSLDWMVSKSLCEIHNFLPEPAPYGSGEFITLTSSIPNADVSGYLLFCSGRGAVIPNGTLIPKDGYLVLSRNPNNSFPFIKGSRTCIPDMI